MTDEQGRNFSAALTVAMWEQIGMTPVGFMWCQTNPRGFHEPVYVDGRGDQVHIKGVRIEGSGE